MELVCTLRWSIYPLVLAIYVLLTYLADITRADNHSSDPGENFNLNATQIGNEEVHALSAKLSAVLRAGPSYGNPGL